MSSSETSDQISDNFQTPSNSSFNLTFNEQPGLYDGSLDKQTEMLEDIELSVLHGTTEDLLCISNNSSKPNMTKVMDSGSTQNNEMSYSMSDSASLSKSICKGTSSNIFSENFLQDIDSILNNLDKEKENMPALSNRFSIFNVDDLNDTLSSPSNPCLQKSFKEKVVEKINLVRTILKSSKEVSSSPFKNSINSSYSSMELNSSLLSNEAKRILEMIQSKEMDETFSSSFLEFEKNADGILSPQKSPDNDFLKPLSTLPQMSTPKPSSNKDRDSLCEEIAKFIKEVAINNNIKLDDSPLTCQPDFLNDAESTKVVIQNRQSPNKDHIALCDDFSILMKKVTLTTGIKHDSPLESQPDVLKCCEDVAKIKDEESNERRKSASKNLNLTLDFKDMHPPKESTINNDKQKANSTFTTNEPKETFSSTLTFIPPSAKLNSTFDMQLASNKELTLSNLMPFTADGTFVKDSVKLNSTFEMQAATINEINSTFSKLEFPHKNLNSTFKKEESLDSPKDQPCKKEKKFDETFEAVGNGSFIVEGKQTNLLDMEPKVLKKVLRRSKDNSCRTPISQCRTSTHTNSKAPSLLKRLHLGSEKNLGSTYDCQKDFHESSQKTQQNSNAAFDLQTKSSALADNNFDVTRKNIKKNLATVVPQRGPMKAMLTLKSLDGNSHEGSQDSQPVRAISTPVSAQSLKKTALSSFNNQESKVPSLPSFGSVSTIDSDKPNSSELQSDGTPEVFRPSPCEGGQVTTSTPAMGPQFLLRRNLVLEGTNVPTPIVAPLATKNNCLGQRPADETFVDGQDTNFNSSNDSPSAYGLSKNKRLPDSESDNLDDKEKRLSLPEKLTPNKEKKVYKTKESALNLGQHKETPNLQGKRRESLKKSLSFTKKDYHKGSPSSVRPRNLRQSLDKLVKESPSPKSAPKKRSSVAPPPPPPSPSRALKKEKISIPGKAVNVKKFTPPIRKSIVVPKPPIVTKQAPKPPLATHAKTLPSKLSMPNNDNRFRRSSVTSSNGVNDIKNNLVHRKSIIPPRTSNFGQSNSNQTKGISNAHKKPINGTARQSSQGETSGFEQLKKNIPRKALSNLPKIKPPLRTAIHKPKC